MVNDVCLSYEETDLTKVAEDLVSAALSEAGDESVILNAVINGISVEAHELQKALNTFLANEMHLHRVCDIYKNAESYVLSFVYADVHEVMGFM